MIQNKLKIFIAEPDNFSLQVIKKLESLGEVNFGPIEPFELKKIFKTYDIFWFRLGFQINEESIGTGPFKCKVVATAVTGTNHIDNIWLKKNGVALISLKGEFEFLKEIRATAEHTFGLMMTISRKLYPAIESVKKGDWNRDNYRGFELYKKTLGIIGMGRLGTIVASYAKNFGMRVIGYDKPKIDFPAFVNRKSDLKNLVNECDFISIHVDLNSDTNKFINYEILRSSRPEAFWINTSRGEVIDEDALLECLLEKKIAGAALDVHSFEHDITKSKLVKYSKKNQNLIISPHIGGNTFESFLKTEMFILSKMINYLSKIEK